VESKWKNYHIITFPGQSLSPKTEKLSLEEAIDLSRDRLILELESHGLHSFSEGPALRLDSALAEQKKKRQLLRAIIG
jgi:hypothetical protein